MRYNIATKADIAIIATAANGTKMTKNYRASYSVEGAFQASNKNIADAVNSVLTDTIADMAQDTASTISSNKTRVNAIARQPAAGSCYAMSSHYLRIFQQPKSAILLILGFASGLPLALTSGTLQAWMTVENIDLKTIGFLARQPCLCL